jgi:hypothetical protein
MVMKYGVGAGSGVWARGVGACGRVGCDAGAPACVSCVMCATLLLLLLRLRHSKILNGV